MVSCVQPSASSLLAEGDSTGWEAGGGGQGRPLCKGQVSKAWPRVGGTPGPPRAGLRQERARASKETISSGYLWK